MIVAIDIGNTNVNFAWFNKGRIIETRKIPTKDLSSLKLKKVLSKYKTEKIIACSVVPKVTATLKSLNFGIKIVGKDIKVPLKCFYNKAQVGADRLAAAFAVRKLYPEARLVFDFGTAITLDFLSITGAYQGGIILPGIGSTVQAFSQCALLPSKIKLTTVKAVIPKNTNESISVGLREGFSAMINSLVKKYKAKLKIPSTSPIILTGGDVLVLAKKLDFSYQYEPFLVLKGLELLARD